MVAIGISTHFSGNKKHQIPQLKGSVKEPKFHNYETEKITRKASDTAEYTESFGSSTRDRPPIYASSCMTISGGRTENVVIGFGELAAVD